MSPFKERPTVFAGKDPKNRLQGIITDRGMEAFEKARARLQRLYARIMGRPLLPHPSDADTIEYLARGSSETRTELFKRRKGQP